MSSELKSDSKIILASSSIIRKKILEDSGIKFDTVSPEVDEDDLKKSPELRGKDLETAKKSCENLIGKPVTILNYPEGTRFSNSKAIKTSSSYKHLLKPRAGGIHTVLSSLGENMTAILNVTMVYPGYSSPNLSKPI